jgi:biotin carboxylase
MAADRPTVLCIASTFTGDRFLIRCKQEGCWVLLLTSEQHLNEPWPRQAIDEVFALPHFQDRRLIVNAVSSLARTRAIRRLVALDDLGVDIAAHLREHLRIPGLGESTARLFRDKLAMRTRGRELGIRVPEFVGIINHDDVRHFLATVPGPWLLKPRCGTSSIGIQKIMNSDDAWRAIEKFGDDQSMHLIERLVPGAMYHVDSLVVGNRVVFAEVNKYFQPLLDMDQSGGVYATRTVPRDRPEVAALREANAKVLTGFGLIRGASHTEFMRADADGEFYFFETSARVGGANTAEMVEAATGIDLWSEWAWLEAHPDEAYGAPLLKPKYGGVVISLARQDHPDTASFNDPEIVHRLDKKQHIGFVVAADTPERVEQLLVSYNERIRRDYH